MLPRVIAGRFEVQTRAGAGGMGTVYRALDLRAGTVVALKILREQTEQGLARFAREVCVLSSLRHPHIVEHIDHGSTDDGEPYLVMEWVEGEDLAARLARGPLPTSSALALGACVAKGLGLAHKKGVVHRDLKPSNILLPGLDIERAKLLDFGVAHLAGSTGELTRTGAAVGTPWYMAPEQARGDREIDGRADLFSLGCVLFECLTGRPPFVAPHALAVLAKVLFEETPALRSLRPGLPVELEQLLTKLLAKEPAERPSDAAAVADDLRTLEAAATEPVSTSLASQRASLTGSERRLISVVLATELDDPLPRKKPASPLAETVTQPPVAPGTPVSALDTISAAPVSPPRVVTLEEVAKRHRARLAMLRERAVAAVLTGAESATDLAARAARCALEIRTLLPGARVAMATGWDVVSGAHPVGEVIDRAGLLLVPALQTFESGAPRLPVVSLTAPIRLDPMTAELLGDRFEITSDGRGPTLHNELDRGAEARRLLGKPTTCIGRERELMWLSALFEECTTEPVARAALVTGPAGIGKSCVRQEFLRRVRDRDDGAEVWIACGDPMSAGSPFGMLAQALRCAAGLEAGDPPAARRRKLDARIAAHVPSRDRERVAAFLGELLGIPAEADSFIELVAARASPVLMGDQMRRAWEDFIGAECAAHPVVLVLEDLHWGDLPTLKFIDSALRNLSDQRFLVLAFARPEIEELFPRMWNEREMQKIRLSGLTRRSCERLVRSALGEAVSEERLDRLVDRSGGNPFFLEELIRSQAQGQSDLPETVLAMIQARLDHLPEAARRLLRAASVFGESFSVAGVTSLLGGEQAGASPESWFADLIEREILTRNTRARAAADGEFVFRHSLLREAVYATLTDGDRVLGHRLAGEWLESAGGGDAIVLAEHFRRGDAPERAVYWYQRAAEHALEGDDLSLVLDRAEQAIACGATGEVLGALRYLQAYAHEWQGLFVEAEKQAWEAMSHLPHGSPLWYRAAQVVAMASGRLGDLDSLASVSGEMLELSSDGGMSEDAVNALAEAIMRFSIAGRRDLVERLHARVEAFASSHSIQRPKVRARIDMARSYKAYLLESDIQTFLERMAAAQASFESAGDLRSAYFTGGDLGYARLEIGAYTEAEQTLRSVIVGASRMGISGVAAVATKNLGMALARLGALEEARSMETAAVRAFITQCDRRMEGGARNYLAIINLLAGDLDAAEWEARAAVEMLVASPLLRIYALATLAAVSLAKGRVAKARSSIRQMLAALEMQRVSFESLGDSAEGESFIRLVHAEVLHAAGEREAAEGAIQAAKNRLLARAAKIRSLSFRQSFLQGVPHNARTLALAEEWSADRPEPDAGQMA